MKAGDQVTITTLQHSLVGPSKLSIVDGRIMVNAETVLLPTTVTIIRFDEETVTFELDDGQVWTKYKDDFENSRT